jgi:hypothetical protein
VAEIDSSPNAADWPTAPPTEPPWAAGPGTAASSPPDPAWAPPAPPFGGSAPPPTAAPAWVPGGAGRPHRPGRPGLVVVAVVVLAVLVLGTATVAVVLTQDAAAPTAQAVDPDPSAPTLPLPPSPGPLPSGRGGATSDPAVVHQEVAALQRFVEQARGLSFTGDVPIEVLAPDAFKAAVLAAAAEDDPNAAGEGDLFRAAGLVPPTYDVAAGERQLLGEGVLGFYEPKKKRLVVKGGARFDPFLRHVLVHELTHALDDQHFPLDRPDLDHATDDRGWAFAALVEGSARRVENAYVAQLPAADKASIDKDTAAMAPDQLRALSDVPLVLTQLQMTPYDNGEPFVSALVQSGGPAALDAALRDPPATAEQILHLPKFTAHEGARAVDAPPADGAVVFDGSLGELMTGVLLHGQDLNAIGALNGGDAAAQAEAQQRLSRGDLDLGRLLDELRGATNGAGGVPTPDGWGGDHFVVYKTAGGGTCVRIDWRMDTAAQLGTLTADLNAWAEADGRAQITRPAGDVVRATRCIPA